MATYLITGVAGFIGSHLAEALLARGHSVRGYDNLSTGKLANIPQGVDFIEADLADAAAIASACRGVDAILHQGALPSVPRSVKEPRPSHNANLDGTFNLLEGARAAGIKRVLYAASSSAYGNQPGFPRVETMKPAPIAPYPVQKLAGELYMQSYAQIYGMETVCLRYFNIFGPRQVPDSQYSGVIAKFALSMLRNEPCSIQGDGEQSRDFTYIDNAVSANLLALEAPSERGNRIFGRVFNVACGDHITLNSIYRILAELTGYTRQPTYTDPRPGDIRMSLADVTAAREAFGYSPRITVREGLAHTVDYYRTLLSPLLTASQR
ncbi:NAD-dependent epimerase/dehydratase family protein [Granulicella sp. 5B5]|uniref:NAD-dependent epimerase/dehydratase family protein n=1 Tax=Granulicella sp. 5B5 TaxID=1617967 RepID=UPI0015F70FCF|nr:NAD-dependent epimerase/dehydratase family protein [Granulicella sp. 5B5]QMV18916.1 NAD-dependent epimerase/dehydratase family protein [Granulicella sp. 5B5]